MGDYIRVISEVENEEWHAREWIFFDVDSVSHVRCLATMWMHVRASRELDAGKNS